LTVTLTVTLTVALTVTITVAGVSIRSAEWAAAMPKEHIIEREAPECRTVNKKKQCKDSPNMHITPLGFAQVALPSLKADFVLYSCGLWPGCQYAQAPELIAASQAAVVSHNVSSVVWATTSVPRGGDAPSDSGTAAVFRAHQARVMSATAVTAGFCAATGDHNATAVPIQQDRLYLDAKHFKQPVYQELNTVLLNLLFN
jgi:hypothetical protein